MARLFSLLVVLLAVVLGGAACTRDPEALEGVRLGMSPRDVRARFAEGGQGTWQTSTGAGDETVLEWTAREEGARIAEARFEFHLGMLVAVRARLAEPIADERVETTPRTVTVRAPGEAGGTKLTVLVRDCPTHGDEAATWAAKAR